MTEDSRWSAEQAEAVVVGRWGADVLVRLRGRKARKFVDNSPTPPDVPHGHSGTGGVVVAVGEVVAAAATAGYRTARRTMVGVRDRCRWATRSSRAFVSSRA